MQESSSSVIAPLRKSLTRRHEGHEGHEEEHRREEWKTVLDSTLLSVLIRDLRVRLFLLMRAFEQPGWTTSLAGRRRFSRCHQDLLPGVPLAMMRRGNSGSTLLE